VKIVELREREKRNFLTTLLLSQGVPMIQAGDEISRTQQGNNNAYCQDSTISWLDWNLDERKEALLDYTTKLIALRKAHPNLRRRKFFQDRKISPATSAKQQVDGLEIHDVAWYRPDGEEMTEEEWHAGWVRCLGLCLSGKTLDDVDRVGERLRDDTYLICLNPHHEHIQFYMPPCSEGWTWDLLFDTRDATGAVESEALKSHEPYDLIEHSTAVFRQVQQRETPKAQGHLEDDQREESEVESVAS
jgi:glycogen operon protein